MSYTKLWSNTNLVFKQSKEHKILLQDFITAINNRIEVEENYASDLRDLSEQLDKHLGKQVIDRSSMIFALSGLKSDLTRRSSQTVSFANHLKDDVLTVLREFLDKQTVQVQKMQKQIVDLESNYRQQISKVKAFKSQLSSADKARQQQFVKLQVIKAKFFLNKQEEQKQASKIRKIQKQYQDSEVATKSAIKQYNDFIGRFHQSIDRNLVQFQRQQEQRINMMMDNIKKILVFEVSMMRNFQYDVTNITNQLATIQVEKDVEEFVKKYGKQVPHYSAESMNKMSLINYVILDMLNKNLDEKIKFDKNQKVRGAISKLIRSQNTEDIKLGLGDNYEVFCEISKIVSKVKKDGLKEETKQLLNKLLEKPENRNCFQLSVRSQIQQDNNQTNESLALLIAFFIEKCLSKKDVFCIRSMLKIMFIQLKLKLIKNKQKLLYGQLIHLPIWKDHGFWDAFLFESVQEQLKINFVKKGEGRQEAKIREKSIILAQLASTSQMMIMLGHSQGSVKELDLKYGKIYSLTQGDYQNLIKIVNEASTNYIQAWIISEKSSGSGSK